MDTLAHALIGAAICSRTGLAGGRRGPRDAAGNPTWKDWTLPAAALFGALPDLTSLAIPLAYRTLTQSPVWDPMHEWTLLAYRFNHSMLGIGILALLFIGCCRKLWLPFLAWPLHVLCDIPTHGSGSTYITPILWPFTLRGFAGWNWWENPYVLYGSWLLVALLWTAIAMLRLHPQSR